MLHEHEARKRSGARACHLYLGVLLVLPLVAGCPDQLTVVITGCPADEVSAGTAFEITVTATDADGNSVTPDATFTYQITQGPQSITITGQGNTRTIDIPAEASEGATVLEATAELADGATGSAGCSFTIGPADACASDAECNDNSACTTDACTADGCENTSVDCDDDLDCTADSCAAATGCVHDDNCAAGLVCSSALGECAECAATADCADADACTDDACSATGTCSNATRVCNDDLTCTTDTCDLVTGCVFTANCPEATPFCTAAGCVGCRTDADCGANQVCTGGACSGECVTDADCSDGLFCNGVETCAQNTCQPGTDPCAAFQCGADEPLCSEGPAAAECSCPDRPCFEFTVATNNLQGTSDSDCFEAPLAIASNNAQVATLQNADRADGQAGADDLSITFAADSAATVTPAGIQNIEVINISDFGDDPTTLDASNISGALEVNSLSSLAMVRVTNLQSAPTLGLVSTGSGANFSFAGSVTGGSADTVTVQLSNAGGGELVITPAGSNGFETVQILSLTSSNILDELDHATASLVRAQFSGSAPVELKRINAGVVTFIASAMTGGGVTLGSGDGSEQSPYVSFHGGTNADIAALVGSPGPDRVIFGATLDEDDAAGSSEIIDLGGGVDFLQAALDADIDDPLPVRNVEELALTAVSGVDVNLTDVNGLTEIIVDADGTAHDLVLQEVEASGAAFAMLHYRGDGQEDEQTYDDVSYEPADAGGTEDALSVVFDNRGLALNETGSANAHVIRELTMPRFENLSVSVEDGPLSVTMAIRGSTLEEVTFTATSDVTLASLTTSGADTILSITAGAVAGNFTVTCNDLTSGAAITTGAGDDSVAIGDSSATGSIVQLGEGDDTYVSTDTDSQDVIQATGGSDVITAGGGNNTVTTGTGQDDVVFNQTAANRRSDISDFTTGSGGDHLVFDRLALGLTGASVFVGAAGDAADGDTLLVYTDAGYDSDAAAAEAVADDIGAGGNSPGVVVYFNSTAGTSHIVYLSNRDTGAGAVHTGTLSNLTSLTAVATIAEANVISQP